MLRELGLKETRLIETGVNYVNSLKVTSKIDFNARQDIVHQAIHRWKQMNPTLRCNIGVSGSQDGGQKFHFKYMNEEGLKPNVFFLHLRNASESADNGSEVTKLLGFMEAFTAFDLTGDQAWRLIFLK